MYKRESEREGFKNNMELIIERLPLNELGDALELATKVFSHEQSIPEKLLNISKDLNPIWWCARIDMEIIGISASWIEKNEWHWGRFAINTRLRGLGIGKQMAIFSLSETFNMGAEEISVEARDVTVGIIEKLGGKVTGKPIKFFGGTITPMTITKSNFFYKNQKSR